MYSRAHLLIEKEMREVNNEPDMSINKLNENSIFELVAYIQGLSHSAWEKGVFKLNLKFTERYNQEPPKVTFQTIPYHPNIDEKTGRPSLDFLDEYTKWKPNVHNIRFILKNLQYLLANPYLDRAVNMGAVFLLKDNPFEFEEIIKESVIASQKLFQKNQQNNPSQLSLNSNQSIKFRKQIQNGTTAHKLYNVNDDNDDEYFSREYAKFQEKTKSFKNISFEDYIDLWRGIATTKASTYEENIYLKSKVFENPAILFQHLSISLKDLEREVYKQLTEHKNLMYGNFDFSNRKFSNEKVFVNNDKDDNLGADRIDEVKRSIINNSNVSNQINLNNNNNNSNEYANNENSKNNFNDTMNESSLNLKTRITPSPKLIKVTVKKASSSVDQQSFLQNDDELFEKEVDDLINWTKNI
jgi:ubiquitin-protein ligase